MLGRFREGWDYYEARFSNKDFAQVQIPTSGPQIRRLADAPKDGDPPLVVWSEQGMGDSIQFVRYLSLLESAGIPFVFLARPVLYNLFKVWTNFGDRVQSLDSAHPQNDKRPHIALMSLPLLFGTELYSVPSSCPYLEPRLDKPNHLHIEPPPGGLSIGLVWASNPDNKAMYRNKSIPLKLIMPRLLDLIDLDLVHVHTLQFGDDSEQLSPWCDHIGITKWNNSITDFSDTAFVVNQLDLVITVDQRCMHMHNITQPPALS